MTESLRLARMAEQNREKVNQDRKHNIQTNYYRGYWMDRNRVGRGYSGFIPAIYNCNPIDALLF